MMLRAPSLVAGSLAMWYSATPQQVQGMWCSNCMEVRHVPDVQRSDAPCGDRDWAVHMAGACSTGLVLRVFN